MAQRASPPLTTLFSRLTWSLQNGGVAVSLRAFSANRAFWGEEILVPEGSPLQLSRLSPVRNALCEARMPLEDVIRVNLYKNT